MKRYIIFTLLLWLLLPLPALPQWPGPGWTPLVPDLTQPLLRNLVHWWRPVPGLIGGNTFYDLVPGTLTHLTLTNMGYSAASGWNGATRRTSLAQLTFDGTNDYATGGTQNTFTTDTQPLSMCVWLKAANIQTGTQLVVGAIDGSNYQIGIGFFYAVGGSNPVFTIGDTNADAQTIRWSGGSWPYTPGLWEHWCVVHTGAGTPGMAMYYNGDGQSVTSLLNAAFFYPYPVTPWNIGAGCCATPGWYFNGAVDEVLVWSRALSALEVRRVYETTQTGSVAFFTNPLPSVMNAPAAAGNPAQFMPFFR